MSKLPGSKALAVKLDEITTRLCSLGIKPSPSPYDQEPDQFGIRVVKGSVGEWEGAMHEAAHAIVLGLPIDKEAGNTVARRIKRLSNLAADWQEIRTLAVEARAADMLGCEVDVATLARFACDNMRNARFKDRPFRVEKNVNRLIPRETTRKLALSLVEIIESR